MQTINEVTLAGFVTGTAPEIKTDDDGNDRFLKFTLQTTDSRGKDQKIAVSLWSADGEDVTDHYSGNPSPGAGVELTGELSVGRGGRLYVNASRGMVAFNAAEYRIQRTKAA